MSKWKKPDTGGHEPCESVSGNHLGPMVKSHNAPGLPGAVEGEGCASEPWGCLELDRAGGCVRHGHGSVHLQMVRLGDVHVTQRMSSLNHRDACTPSPGARIKND